MRAGWREGETDARDKIKGERGLPASHHLIERDWNSLSSFRGQPRLFGWGGPVCSIASVVTRLKGRLFRLHKCGEMRRLSEAAGNDVYRRKGVHNDTRHHQSTRLKAHVLAQQVSDWAGWAPIKGLPACAVRPKRAATCERPAVDMRSASCILARGVFFPWVVGSTIRVI
jgi:hypothetical protein